MPSILVHTCCASCSSHVLEYLQRDYDPIAYYYNPNIQPAGEFELRHREMEIVCDSLGVKLISGPYDPQRWNEAIAPHRHLPEKSARCWECYRLRLEAAAGEAAARGIGLFTTTLSVSPHKIHERIVAEGRKAGEIHGVEFLAGDFKKRGGFKNSVEKSIELGLTRQDYCGCVLSLEESLERKRKRP